MKGNPPASITRIPIAAYFGAPLLYGIGLGLHVLFPIFGERYLLQILLFVLPCVLVLSFWIVGLRLLAAPSRTWGLIFALFIHLVTSSLSLWLTWLAMTFPVPD